MRREFLREKSLSKNGIRVIATIYFFLWTYILSIFVPIFVEWIILQPFDFFLIFLILTGFPLASGYFASGYGLWDLKEWGLYIAMGTTLSFMLYYLISIIYAGIIRGFAFEDFNEISISAIVQLVTILLLWNSKKMFS